MAGSEELARFEEVQQSRSEMIRAGIDAVDDYLNTPSDERTVAPELHPEFVAATELYESKVAELSRWYELDGDTNV